MRKIPYLKSIDEYLDKDDFFRILEDSNYITPIRRINADHIDRPIDISIKICDLMTFSPQEIQEIEEYCKENGRLIEEKIERTDCVNMLLLWGEKTFFEKSMDDNPYLYQTTQSSIRYTISSPSSSPGGVRLKTKLFTSELLDKKFGHRYLPYLRELKSVLLNSGWFEELKIRIKNRLSREYFYNIYYEVENKFKLIDMSDDKLIHLAFMLYNKHYNNYNDDYDDDYNRIPQLFSVRQDYEDEEGVHFNVHIYDEHEEYKYDRYILTQEEFKTVLQNVMKSLEPYNSFWYYRDNLETILDVADKVK